MLLLKNNHLPPGWCQSHGAPQSCHSEGWRWQPQQHPAALAGDLGSYRQVPAVRDVLMSPDQCTVKEAPSAARPAPIAPSNWRISFASTVINVFPLRGTLPLGAIRELNGTNKVGNSGTAHRAKHPEGKARENF